ncbi:MAG: T9SS type A sorting domain-containing protein [Ignavibacteria bacterium]
MSQNYPNPSNPKSKIDYEIPFDGNVSIKVYDILGKEIITLVNEFKTADFYSVEFDGSNLASGMYFYRITANGGGKIFSKTLKMILVK